VIESPATWPRANQAQARERSLMSINLVVRELSRTGSIFGARLRFAKDRSGTVIAETPDGRMAMLRLTIDGQLFIADMTPSMMQSVRLRLARWYPDDPPWPVGSG